MMEISAEELAESMFFTRCLIDEKVFLVLVDGGRERNLISSRIVSKLWLQSQFHPAPYSLRLPYKKYPNIVMSQVAVEITIGKYKVWIMCDVVYDLPSGIILGHPWFHDRQVRLVNRRSNKFSLQSRSRVFVLKPLSPEEVIGDLKDGRRIQEEYQKALIEKRWSWKVDQAMAPIRVEELYSSKAEQSGEERRGEALSEPSSSKTIVDTPGVDSLEEIDTIQVESTSSIQTGRPCFPTAIQGKKESETVGSLGAASEQASNIETFVETPRMCSNGQLE
ncbi:unnamed protein product [Linum trigynum]|uniref:Uncharacterized protein n=1 Tax=Linum trigynum TaxID=586398 RepID=A0AAV2CWH0_9ROSI